MRVEKLPGNAQPAGSPKSDPSIDQLWREQARRLSDAHLAMLAALIVPALLVVVATVRVAALRPWWPLLLLPAAASAFGFWGISDRELTDIATGDRATGWRVLRGASVALAAACFAVAILLFLRLTVGTWIS